MGFSKAINGQENCSDWIAKHLKLEDGGGGAADGPSAIQAVTSGEQ